MMSPRLAFLLMFLAFILAVAAATVTVRHKFNRDRNAAISATLSALGQRIIFSQVVAEEL